VRRFNRVRSSHLKILMNQHDRVTGNEAQETPSNQVLLKFIAYQSVFSLLLPHGKTALWSNDEVLQA
jgi:hypothetical protein